MTEEQPERINVDLDRPMYMQTSVDGEKVCMYQDEPGLYFTLSGKVVSEEFAAENGFDTEYWHTEAERIRLRKEAEDEIEERLAQLERDTKAMDRDPKTAAPNGGSGPMQAEGQTIPLDNGYELIGRGGGWYDVRRVSDGEKVLERKRRAECEEFLKTVDPEPGSKVAREASGTDEGDA